MRTTSELPLPPALTEYIDGIAVEHLDGIGVAGTVDFRLAYGSDEQEDRWLEVVDTELRYHADAYTTHLEQFLSTGPNYGLQEFALAEGNIHPPHQESSGQLEGWLYVARKYLPGAEGEVMDEIVECVDYFFDPEEFELAPSLAPGGAYHLTEDSVQRKLHRRARELAGATARQLSEYATSAETVQSFLDSSLAQMFGDETAHILLQRRILELRSEKQTPAYAALIEQAASLITAESWYQTSKHLDWLLRDAPAVALRIMDEQPDLADQIRDLGRIGLQHIADEERTAAHDKLFAGFEAQAAGSLTDLAYYVTRHFEQTGSYKPEHIEQIKAIVERSESTNPWACRLLYTVLPIDEVSAILTKHPASLRELGLSYILVRRFAAAGQMEQAYALARKSEIADSHHNIVDPIRNLLAIYDETGDESARVEAEQRWHTALSDPWLSVMEHEAHEMLARTFLAAKRHGHTAVAELAREQMEPFYTHERASVRHKCIGQMLRVALDDGDLPEAERLAVALHDSRLQLVDDYEGRDRRFDALLHVIRAYVNHDDMEAATRLVRTYFAIAEPDYTLQTAIELLQKQPSAFVPALHASSFNPITDVMRRRV